MYGLSRISFMSTEKAAGYCRHRMDYLWIDPFPGERVTLHVEGADTQGRFSCGEALLAPGAGQPLHIHHGMDELLYVVEGEVDFTLEGERFRTGPGGFAFIRRGSVHGFRNLSEGAARLLGVFSPPMLDGFFQAMIENPTAEVPKIARQFGIEFVGPMMEPLGA